MIAQWALTVNVLLLMFNVTLAVLNGRLLKKINRANEELDDANVQFAAVVREGRTVIRDLQEATRD